MHSRSTLATLLELMIASKNIHAFKMLRILSEQELESIDVERNVAAHQFSQKYI